MGPHPASKSRWVVLHCSRLVEILGIRCFRNPLFLFSSRRQSNEVTAAPRWR
ncbi:hypothetical protein JB92DRAFT_2806162, partial [Gautieria morchelliformis]